MICYIRDPQHTHAGKYDPCFNMVIYDVVSYSTSWGWPNITNIMKLDYNYK